MKDLGTRIRELRKRSRLTLAELSKRTDIDTATLSRIENGRMTGTIQCHMALAKALRVRLPDLYDKVLEAEHQSSAAPKAPEISGFSQARGSTSELLTPHIFQKKMSPIRMTLKAHAETPMEELPLGTERFVYVVSGKIAVVVKDEERSLSEGETLYMNAALPHQFVNKSKSTSSYLVVSTPSGSL